MTHFYVADSNAREVLGHRERPLSPEGRRLKAVFQGLDDHGAQVTVDEMMGRNFALEQVEPDRSYGHRRLSQKHQAVVLTEVMHGVDPEQIVTALDKLNTTGHEVMIRDRSRGLGPMAS